MAAQELTVTEKKKKQHWKVSKRETPFGEQYHSHPYSNSDLFKMICSICWPPCPASMARKAGFQPPVPSYDFETKDDGQTYIFKIHDSFKLDNMANIEPFKVLSRSGNIICMAYIKCTANPPYTILHSHVNGMDIGQTVGILQMLGNYLGVNMLSYDYSGYGRSTGKPWEKQVYQDAETALEVLKSKYKVKLEDIILFGQSIGTAVTTHLASQYEVAGVILNAPLLSGLRVICSIKSSWKIDAFKSIDRLHLIQSPVLVVHGTEDEIIDFSHGLETYDLCPVTVEPLWIEGGSHLDAFEYKAFTSRLYQFVREELPKLQAWKKA